LAYVELRYYRAHALEIREFGDSGWAIHIYASGASHRAGKLAVIETVQIAGLQQALADARAIVDASLKTEDPR
jgi:hypothetical protein